MKTKQMGAGGMMTVASTWAVMAFGVALVFLVGVIFGLF